SRSVQAFHWRNVGSVCEDLNRATTATATATAATAAERGRAKKFMLAVIAPLGTLETVRILQIL
ncbi:MAG: hypothetical protein WCB61_02755, partial [Pseudolabrys sp.]